MLFASHIQVFIYLDLNSVLKEFVNLLSLEAQETKCCIHLRFASWLHELLCMAKVIKRADCSVLLHLLQVFPHKALLSFKKLWSKHSNDTTWQ